MKHCSDLLPIGSRRLDANQCLAQCCSASKPHARSTPDGWCTMALQEGGPRLGEDWRRSSNATWDVPRTTTSGTSQPCQREERSTSLGTRPPERLPSMTGGETTVPQCHVPLHRLRSDAVLPHMAMCFGTAASVWNFNCVAASPDALAHLGGPLRGRLQRPGERRARRPRLPRLLGLLSHHRAADQGIEGRTAETSTRPTRCGRPHRPLHHAECRSCASPSARLTPQEAGCLAGKLSFLTQAVFGAVGRSAMQPLYAHDMSTSDDQSLSVGLMSALNALHCMLGYICPIPYAVNDQRQAVIFADAYVRTARRYTWPATSPLTPSYRHTPGTTTAGDTWSASARRSCTAIPQSVLRQITSRKAFIYDLEVFAQLMAILALAKRLPPNSWLAFIDNTAGEAALKEGYGKDGFVNGMLATFRGTAARRGWRPQFARVESTANVADAISRGDLSRAVREEWTRLDDHTDAITDVEIFPVFQQNQTPALPTEALFDMFC